MVNMCMLLESLHTLFLYCIPISIFIGVLDAVVFQVRNKKNIVFNLKGFMWRALSKCLLILFFSWLIYIATTIILILLFGFPFCP